MSQNCLGKGVQIAFQHGEWDIHTCENWISLVSVIRNEELLLESFIRHYSESGVTHFIFFDNLSSDNTSSILRKQKEINIRVYNASGSYREALFGTQWVSRYMQSQPIGNYYIIVDIDEYLIVQEDGKNQIKTLVQKMRENNYATMPAMLIDMYSPKNASSYLPGDMPWISNPYYDRFNNDYYAIERSWKLLGLYNGVTGGVRKRLFSLDGVCLTKFPILRFCDQRLSMGPGYHTIRYESENICNQQYFRSPAKPEPMFLLHFKFIKPNMKEFVLERVARNQDWDNSIEYQKYLHYFSCLEQDSSYYKGGYSKYFKGYQALKEEFKEIFLAD